MIRATGLAIVGMIFVGVCAGTAQQEVCRVEVDKFCKAVKTGEGRLIKCLRAHDADLSDECRARVNTMARFAACLEDAMRLCPSLEPIGGEAIMCLRTHETDLSTACKNEIREGRL